MARCSMTGKNGKKMKEDVGSQIGGRIQCRRVISLSALAEDVKKAFPCPARILIAVPLVLPAPPC